MKKQAFYLLLITMFSLSLASCMDSDNDDYDPNKNTLYDIVTLTLSNDKGQQFQYQVNEDSEVIILTSSEVRVDTTICPVGNRLLLAYEPTSGVAQQSGTIIVQGYSTIFNDDIRADYIKDYPDWDDDGIYLYSLWRTGTYLNLHGLAPFSNSQTLALMTDSATIDNEYPEVYVIYRTEQERDSYDRALYASFDIASLWNKKTCKGLNVHIKNTNLEKYEYKFVKQPTFIEQ